MPSNAYAEQKWDDLAASLRDEMGQLRLESAHRDEQTISEQSRISEDQRQTLERLISLQVEDVETRGQRQKLWNKLLAGLITMLTAAAGGGIWVGAKRPTEAEIIEDTRPVVEGMDKVKKRVDVAEIKIERLKSLALEQQVQISDSVEYLGDKIDAIAPRRSGRVELPASLEKAKRKANAIRASEDLFVEPDPFVGLEPAR